MIPCLDESTENFEAALLFLDDFFQAVQSSSEQLQRLTTVRISEEDEEDSGDKRLRLQSHAALSSYKQSTTSLCLEAGSLLSSTSDEALRSGIRDPSNNAPHQQQPTEKQVQGTHKKKRRSNPNRAREERKQELIYLRKKVVEMEQELERLQLRPKRLIGDPSTSIRDIEKEREELAEAVANGLIIPSVWEEIAARQAKERTKSERENVRLRLILESQIRIAKNLEKILKKPSTVRSNQRLQAYGLTKRLKCFHPSTHELSDAAILEELVRGVEKSYMEVDAVFTANGLALTETQTHDVQLCNSADGMYMEIIANKIVPFEKDATGKAVWQHYARIMEYAPYRSYYRRESKSMGPSEDTIVENIGLEVFANKAKADFCVKQILRRYVEEDRIVIVWQALIDPVEFLDQPVSGIRFREKGYIIIKRPSTMPHAYSLLQTCYIITPEITSTVMREDHVCTNQLTELVLNETTESIAGGHQTIENVLLTQVMS